MVDGGWLMDIQNTARPEPVEACPEPVEGGGGGGLF